MTFCVWLGADWAQVTGTSSHYFSQRAIRILHAVAPMLVEVIDSPEHAANLKSRYPYLDIRSILEIETHDIGQNFVSEITGGPPRRFADLPTEEAQEIVTASSRLEFNWFRMWLVQMAEGLHRDLGPEATATPSGALRRWTEI